MAAKPITHRDDLMKIVKKHIKLALTYAEDGGFATAGKVLREAADIFIAENDRRHRILNKALSGDTVFSEKDCE